MIISFYILLVGSSSSFSFVANPPISGNIEEEEADEDILENETQEVPADSGDLKPILGMCRVWFDFLFQNFET